MEKIKIIANPISGREQSIAKINELVSLMGKDGTRFELCFTKKRKDATKFAMEDNGEDLIISVGGDGTLNEVANGMYKAKRRVPLAVIPCGTVNDFATAMNIPLSMRQFYKMLKENRQKEIDLGMAGEQVFVNVAAGGFLTEIAYQVPEDRKAMLGRIAYYIEGIKEIVRIGGNQGQTVELDIKCDKLNSTEEVTLFVITNSTSVGGFKHIAPDAQVQDGYLDVLIVKKVNMIDLPALITSALNGRHVNHDKVIYLKTKEIEISSKKKLKIDLDGEEAGELPMKFKVLSKAIKLVVKK